MRDGVKLALLMAPPFLSVPMGQTQQPNCFHLHIPLPFDLWYPECTLPVLRVLKGAPSLILRSPADLCDSPVYPLAHLLSRLPHSNSLRSQLDGSVDKGTLLLSPMSYVQATQPTWWKKEN